MWNEAAEAHKTTFTKHLKYMVLNPDYTFLGDVDKSLLDQIGIKEKSVAQLCCNNGIELISIKRAGAKRCVGFDISEVAIQCAKELAELAKNDIDFICSDIYTIKQEHYGQFDLIYITIGAFGWLPELEKALKIAYSLLNENGQIFIYEMHPILNIFKQNTTEIQYSYFDFGPHKEESEPDYIDNTVIINSSAYWFHHTLADIINGLIKVGFAIKHFSEYSEDISGIYKELSEQEHLPPMSYILIANK